MSFIEFKDVRKVYRMGEVEVAARYRRLYEQGREYAAKALFNGEYFIQRLDLTDRARLAPFQGADAAYWNAEAGEIKYQIQDGCGIDQVLAAWMSELSGLGDILPDDEVLRVLNEDRSFFQAAHILRVPPELLDFKFRILKRQGYALTPPLYSRSGFMRDIDRPDRF